MVQLSLKPFFMDLVVGAFIVIPALVLALFVYNPAQQEAKKQDKAKSDTINIIARALEPHFKKDGIYPPSLDVLDFTPPDLAKYSYEVSPEGKDMILFIAAESLAWKEYCNSENAHILYSSDGRRTGIVCSDSPTPGPQEFAN